VISETLLRRLAFGTAALATALGAVALAGLRLHIVILTTLWPGWRPMSQNSALCFLLSGAALLLTQRAGRLSTWAGRILAGLVCVLTGTALITYAFSRTYGWSEAVFYAPPRQTEAEVPLNTMLPFALIGLGVLTLSLPRRSWFSLSNWLGLAAGSYALLSLTGLFLHPAPEITSRMSVASGFGFLLLGTSVFSSRFDPKFLHILSRQHPLGFLALRLLFFGLILPLLVYAMGVWLLLPVIPAYHDVLVLIVTVMAILLLGALMSSLQRMEALDRQRRDAEATRDAVMARLQHQAATLEMQVAERTRKLHETTRRLQLALHSGDYGVWDLDLGTGRLLWDERMCAIYGIEPAQFDGQRERWLNMVHPDDRARIQSVIGQHIESGSAFDDEYRIVRADGKVRHIATRGTVHRDATGRTVRVVGLNRDITAEREREQTLSALNQRLLFVLNATGCGVWEYDFATDQMQWDDHLLEIYGLRREQLTGFARKDWQVHVHPDDLPEVIAQLDAAVAGRQLQFQQQFRIVRPDGTVRYLASHSYLLRDAAGRPESMVGFDSDITEQHDLREELRIIEERWRLALAGNNDGVWDWNVTTGEVFRDDRIAQIIGYQPPELANDRHLWQDLGHPEDIPAANAALADHLEGRKPVYQGEYRLRHKDGHWVWVLDRAKIVARDPKGAPLRVTGTLTDITPRKQMEERLRHGEEMSLQLGRLAQIGAWEWELGSSRLNWSPEMFRIHEVELGYEPTLAKSLEFYPPQAKSTLSEALQQAVRTGTGFDLELPFATARGHKLWVRVLGRAEMREGHPVRVYGAFQDITGRRDAEEMRRQLEGQLFQAQKMETLGTLAGGIAHDFNNLLTGILGYQDLALDTLPEGADTRNYLIAARDASLRARELVDQILTFSRQAGSEKVPVNLGQVIEDARRFLRATVPATIRIEVDVAPDCGRVMADATQIHQVLLNLGSNAAHAMRTTGGTMKLSLKTVQLDDASAAALNHLESGRYLKLEFSDTGHGMDEETRKRIFDPFFTTKEVGQGTGLGLSVVHGIIQAHRGTITVQSAPGRGATFTMYFPEAHAEAEESAADYTALPRGNGELIAVVDDEDIVRSFAQMALEKMGYRVASFDSPAHCLDALRRRPEDFALLLTDQTMPVMKGIELAAEARSTAPRLPVIIMSGYFSRISPEKLAQIGHVALLSKPFTNDELARAIHRGIYPTGSSSPFAKPAGSGA
jgi:PAS domain S-box-containing protein